jgi:hypothetical protein
MSIRHNLFVITGVLKDTAAFVEDPLARKDVGTAIYLIHRAIRHLKQAEARRTPDEIADRERVDEILHDTKDDPAALNRHGIRIL